MKKHPPTFLRRRRAEERAQPPLRFIRRGLLGLWFSLPLIAACCMVLRSRWYQSGVRSPRITRRRLLCARYASREIHRSDGGADLAEISLDESEFSGDGERASLNRIEVEVADENDGSCGGGDGLPATGRVHARRLPRPALCMAVCPYASKVEPRRFGQMTSAV